MEQTNIVWFRLDLRLSDNSAWNAAAAAGKKVLPVFIWNPEAEGNWSPGAASRWWLHYSLESLERQLREIGSRLIIRCGDSLNELEKLQAETRAEAIYFNSCFTPELLRRDERVIAAFQSRGIAIHNFNSSLLHNPSNIATREGKPFRVFTPFWKQLSAQLDHVSFSPAKATPGFPEMEIESAVLESLNLLPKIHWDDVMKATWVPGEKGARARVEVFSKHALHKYSFGRDRPDHEGVSMLSPHLHFGEISVRQLWCMIEAQKKNRNADEISSTNIYLKELGWREFAHHVLFHFPMTSEQPLYPQFSAFPWLKDDALIKAWQKGETGYPIVDAGMRQLWSTGWMHNRVRMIVASFLTKDLLISWNEGSRWFWDTLVDADLASNSLGWQWSAGCGADAAPYFRIFNPILQSEKFDPDGNYIRRWVPELVKLPSKWIHKPWLAPELLLRSADLSIGKDYPAPVIDHSIARQRALDAFSKIKNSR